MQKKTETFEPKYYDGKIVVGTMKEKGLFRKSCIVTENDYLDMINFPEIFGDSEEKHDREETIIKTLQTHAYISNKKIKLSKFFRQNLSQDLLNSDDVKKGKYILPKEVNDESIKVIIRYVKKKKPPENS